MESEHAVVPDSPATPLSDKQKSKRRKSSIQDLNKSLSKRLYRNKEKKKIEIIRVQHRLKEVDQRRFISGNPFNTNDEDTESITNENQDNELIRIKQELYSNSQDTKQEIVENNVDSSTQTQSCDFSIDKVQETNKTGSTLLKKINSFRNFSKNVVSTAKNYAKSSFGFASATNLSKTDTERSKLPKSEPIENNAVIKKENSLNKNDQNNITNKSIENSRFLRSNSLNYLKKSHKFETINSSKENTIQNCNQKLANSHSNMTSVNKIEQENILPNKIFQTRIQNQLQTRSYNNISNSSSNLYGSNIRYLKKQDSVSSCGSSNQNNKPKFKVTKIIYDDRYLYDTASNNLSKTDREKFSKLILNKRNPESQTHSTCSLNMI